MRRKTAGSRGRQNSSVGRRLAAVWMAVLMVGSVVAGAMPAAAQEEPPVSDGETSLATSLFKSMAEGAAGEVGGAAAGWVLSSLGLSGASDDESAALASINDDLNEIITQLSDIEQELAQLEAAIDQLDCDSLSANTLQARTLIDSLAQTYQSFADQAAGTFGIPSVPPVDGPNGMTNWADDVTDDINGVGPAISLISNALLPAGSAQGIISACLQPSVIIPPDVNTIGDTSYYDQVANLINFYYTYQARGLLLLQEAYHFQAQQASGETYDADDPGQVCTMATDPSAISACTSAIEYTNDLYQQLFEQFELGGLPWTNDSYITVNRGTNTPFLMVKSLEAYTQATDPGSGCSLPLTSENPCGPTVGTVNDTGHMAPYAGQDLWQPASAPILTDMIARRGSLTPAQYMNEHGFENAGNKIVITPDETSWDLTDLDTGLEWVTGLSATCFLDTNKVLDVVCDSDSVNELLRVIEYSSKCFVDRNPAPTWEGIQPGVYANSFYRATIAPSSDCSEFILSPVPGWWGGATGSNTHQFRWPSLNVASVGCTTTNPGGVYTRCGNSFNEVFNTLVPRPVTCSGTTVGVCSDTDTAQVALTGPQAGVWSWPVLDGDVSVESDGGLVDRITGTLKLSAIDGQGAATVTFNIRRAGGKDPFYTGNVKIKPDGEQVVVIPLKQADLNIHEDGTVSGQLTHGASSLIWWVRDHNPA